MQPHEEEFFTRQYELDTHHLLRVQCLCNYMEEAAGNHAERLGAGLPRLLEDNLAWVLAKMRLVIHRRPGPGETIRVSTWPVCMERVQFRRDFIVHDAAGRALAAAVTQWVVMGTLSRRLERFPMYIAAMQPENPPLALESGDIRVPVCPQEADAGPVFPVRMADIDQNRHVNNGRYIDFALEAADCAGARGELGQLDVIFRAEGVRGDAIAVKTAREAGDGQCFIHSLVRAGDEHELARVRTIFHGS